MQGSILSRCSKAFTYPLLGPLFLLTSSYAQLCPSLVQVLQLGLFPSHFSFLLRQIMHARRLVLGTLAFPLRGSSADPGRVSDTMMVSGGVPVDEDMLDGQAIAKRECSCPPTIVVGSSLD